MDTLIFAIWTTTLSIIVAGVLPLAILEWVERNPRAFMRAIYRLYLQTFALRYIRVPIMVTRARVVYHRARLVTLRTQYQAPTYAMATVNPLRAMVRAFIQNQAGAVGSVWRADVEAIDKDDAKGRFTTVAVVPLDTIPGWLQWSKLSARKQAKQGPRTPITRYAENVLATVDRYSVMLAQFGLIRSPWTIDADISRARGGHETSYQTDVTNILQRASKVLTITAHPEGIAVALQWSDSAPQTLARVFHSWLVERPLVVRNTRGSGRTGNASDDDKGKATIGGQSTARLQAWLGAKVWSWHGRSFHGVSSMARIMAHTVPVPAGYLSTCPACGALRVDDEKTCEDCSCTLVRTWTSERGRLRAHWTDSDYKGRDGTRKLYGEFWTGDYEVVRDELRNMAQSYSETEGIRFDWSARSTVQDLNRARKLEQGC